MQRTNVVAWLAPATLTLMLAPAAIAQFSSTARMLSLTQTYNQSLWSSQQSLERTIRAGELVAEQPQTSTQAPVPVASGPRYAIVATDFQGMPWRETPVPLANNLPNVTPAQKLQIQNYYYQILNSYETGHRKNNVAFAVAYAVGVSLEIGRRQALSPDENNALIAYVNDMLADAPRFRQLSPQQKQILYESSILSGAMAAMMANQGNAANDPGLRAKAEELAQTILRQWTGG